MANSKKATTAAQIYKHVEKFEKARVEAASRLFSDLQSIVHKDEHLAGTLFVSVAKWQHAYTRSSVAWDNYCTKVNQEKTAKQQTKKRK